MKKLLIAAALTASFYSFGDAINSQTFEPVNDVAYTLAGDSFMVFTEGDTSAVAAYGDVAASDKTTAAGAVGDNYLNLSTEGNTLWRTIETGGTAKSVAATGTYIDTLVQFTATEEAPTTFEDGAKLAMWLQATDNGDGTATTNLYVRGASITTDPAGSAVLVATPANVALDATVEAGTWYRLTVKAVTVAAADTGNPITAFAIYIDGVLVNPVTSFVAQDWIDYIKGIEASTEATFFAITDMNLLKTSLVPSVTAGVDGDQSLYGVGFKGTGAIDSIAWTDDDLFPSVAPGFTLTIAFGEGVEAATYAIGDATAAAVTAGQKIEVASGAAVTIKVTEVDDWFVAPADTTIASMSKNEEITLTATAVTSANIGTLTDTTVPADSADAVLAWAKGANKTTDQVKAAKYLYSDYLLGFTEFSAEEPTIEVVSIDFDENGVPVVEAKVTVGGVTKIEELSSATGMNGALKYKAAATLQALKTAEAKAAIEAGDQFIKVVVE